MMSLSNATYPVIALGEKAIFVFARSGSITKCYEELLIRRFRGTTFIDSDSRCWRCESFKILRSLIPLWKRLFVANFVEVELSLTEPETISNIAIVKQMISKHVHHAQNFVFNAGDRIFECGRERKILMKINDCISKSERIIDITNGIQNIIIENG